MAGISASYVDSDTFTVTGDQIKDFNPGRRIKADCGVDGDKYGWVLSTSLSGNTTVNLTSDSDALTANLTEVYYAQTDIDQHPDVVSSGSNITDNKLIRGDGGVKGVQHCSTITVSDNGEMVNTGQPAFHCYITSDVENVTGDSTTYSITGAIWTEQVDRGNNFSNGTFTAPVDGFYQLNVTVALGDVNSTHEFGFFKLISSNRTISFSRVVLDSAKTSSPWFSGAQLVWMDANDTAYLTLQVEVGDKIIDVSDQTTFSGALIC